MACPYWKRGYCVADKGCTLEHNPEEGGQLQETFLAQQRSQKQSMGSSQQALYQQISAVTMASALYGGAPAMAYAYGYCPPMYGMMSQPAPGPAKNYKTVPCRHFVRGHCMRGAACGFRHGDDDSSSSAPNGLVGQLPAELSNPLYPGRPFRVVTCRRWAQGSCSLGDRCTFRHDFENPQPMAGVKRQLSGSENVVPSDQEPPVQESKVLKTSSEL